MPTNQFIYIKTGEVDTDGELASPVLTYKYINLHYIIEVFIHPITNNTIIRVMLGYEVVEYIVPNEDVEELMDRINKTITTR